MKNLLLICGLLSCLNQPLIDQRRETAAEKLKRDLLGTWDCVTAPEVPKSVRHTKLVAPGRFTWVTFDSEKQEILSVCGGTWALEGDKYTESCEFASDTHQHLRGKTFTYDVTVTPEKWDLKGVPGTEINVDEVWNRMKPDDSQKANTEPRGKELLGTWESTIEGAPKALQFFKYLTPTHWTWVVFDRENKMVLGAIGGTWALKHGEYVETVDFSTDNYARFRGNSNPYGFEVRGDQWFIRRGPDVEGAREKVWRRVK
jgi:hypothetical protein